MHRALVHRSVLSGLDVVDLTSGRSFPRHAHDQFGVGVITAGAQRSWSGVGVVEAIAGDLITVNPGEVHDGIPLGSQVRSWRMLYIEPSFLARILREDVPPGMELARPALRDERVAACFAGLFEAVTARWPEHLAIEEALVRMWLCLVGRHGSRSIAAAGSSPCVKLALRRLDEAECVPVTLAELAALSGVSRFQLLRGFARSVGMTPHAYLLQRRVQRARRLLAAGQGPAAVAAATGFADQSHLTRAFVRQLGVTPGRYRSAVA